jgi:hypothetical protein
MSSSIHVYNLVYQSPHRRWQTPSRKAAAVNLTKLDMRRKVSVRSDREKMVHAAGTTALTLQSQTHRHLRRKWSPSV